MKRSLATSTVVVLPSMNAVTVAGLLQELLARVAAESAFPPLLLPDRDELSAAYATLNTELSNRIAVEGYEPEVRAADVVEDNAVAALHDFLLTWVRLPADKHPESAQAALIIKDVFPTGLVFLTLPPKDEWQEVETRRGIIAAKKHDVTIKALGGQTFLDHLADAHTAYGAVLSKTTVKAKVTHAVGEARDAAIESIRVYSLRVLSNVRSKDPSTIEMADRLLAPIDEVRTRLANARRPAPADDDMTAPAATTSPATTGAATTPAATGATAPATSAAPAAAKPVTPAPATATATSK